MLHPAKGCFKFYSCPSSTCDGYFRNLWIPTGLVPQIKICSSLGYFQKYSSNIFLIYRNRRKKKRLKEKDARNVTRIEGQGMAHPNRRTIEGTGPQVLLPEESRVLPRRLCQVQGPGGRRFLHLHHPHPDPPDLSHPQEVHHQRDLTQIN
jgi:hypothetical protein